MAGGRGGSLLRCGPVAKIPQVGERCVTVGVSAGRAIEADRHGNGAVVRALRLEGGGRRLVGGARRVDDAAYLAAVGEGAVVECLARAVGPKDHVDRPALPQPAPELRPSEAPPSVGVSLKILLHT